MNHRQSNHDVFGYSSEIMIQEEEIRCTLHFRRMYQKEYDMELARNRIDTTNMEKLPYKKFAVRMVVPATEHGKKRTKFSLV